MLCSSDSNKWSIANAVNYDTGEEFEAKGNFWNCYSKLCPTCTARSSSIARKQLIKRISEQTLKRGDRFYFPTLTIKNPNLSLTDTRFLMNRAWTLFRKRQFFRVLILGGFKSEEFTLTRNGFHYHLHLLIQSKFILFNEFRRTWTECVEKAFFEQDIPFKVQTSDKWLIVRFQPIADISRIPHELCKYITKTDSWSKLSDTALKQIALVRRWSRMREFFGEWKTSAKAKERHHQPIVHTKSLTDGKVSAVANPDAWRDRVWLIGNLRYRAELREEFRKAREFRRMQLQLRWRHASIIDLGVIDQR